ncbi:cyclic nucleotide-binding domain-containing protein [Marinomonas mediterranea]|uniref:cyclic nucleotide-binding domain-containing protein n=1 Tax=Marinomonas mediterranea TaxID=119864 RepID=UPI002349E280|nr:cyclic nucleotide-binding domain-containing protein [Marinomonas mediterranea]WCN13260.1 cyclic nucleotide-binding domain-containing protein [Marinomonas mediterranea]
MNTVNRTRKQNYRADYFKSGSVFGALSEPAIEFMINEGKILSYEKGEFIFEFGEKVSSFFIIIEGEVDFYKQHNEAIYHTRTVSFGEALGFVSMIALHDRVGSAKAKTDCVLLEVNNDLFNQFHDQYAFDFGILILNLARDMARAVRHVSNVLVEKETILDTTRIN